VLRRYSEGVFEVIVDDTSSAHLLDSLTLAIGPASLEEYLRGDASHFFEQDIESRFNEDGDVKSGFWEPLSEATVNIREWYGYGGEGPINVRTGALQEFVQFGREFLAGDTWAEMQVPGAAPNPLLERKLKTAQECDNSPNPLGSGPTPARPVLAVSDMDLMKLMELLVVHIDAFIMAGSLAPGAAA